MIEIGIDGQTTAPEITDALAHQTVQFLGVEFVFAAATGAGRYLTKQFFDQGDLVLLDIAPREVRAHQAHAAVDVVTHSAGRDHAALVRIGCRHSADAEPVSP